MEDNEKEGLKEDKSTEELNNDRNKIINEISKLGDELTSLAKEKEDLLVSEEYKQLLKLIAEKNELEMEIQKLKDRLYTDFSIFDRPFKKYKRDVNKYEKIIEHYATDTLNALLIDSEFKIVEVLEKMSENIVQGGLGLKERKAQKVMEQISRMDQQYFRDFLKKYNLIVENKERIASEIKENNANEEIDRIDCRQDSIKSEIEHMKQELESEKHDSVKKLKQCPKCGKEIPSEWLHHKDCGWKEEKRIEEDEAMGKVKIEVFTSPTCPHCPHAAKLAYEVAKERDDVKVTELSTATPHGRRKAQQMEVMTVPTTFVTGPKSSQKIAFRGLPSRNGLLKAIDISLGKAEWKEPKGLFRSLLEKLPIKIKW